MEIRLHWRSPARPDRHFRPLDNQKDGRSLFTDAAPVDEEVPF